MRAVQRFTSCKWVLLYIERWLQADVVLQNGVETCTRGSQKAAERLRQMVRREWKLQSRTYLSLEELDLKFNPVIVGWMNYYGRFCSSALHSVLNLVNMALELWGMRKFKHLRRRKTRAHAWLKTVAQRSPWLFAHWNYQVWMTGAV